MKQRRTELERYLDLGRGECYLRRPELAAVVEGALLFFHGKRYELRAWVVMSNHVHVLFEVGSKPMSEVVASWKKHTAVKANKLLRRKGQFWELDYWDTYMRDAEHELRTRRYIESNPVRAGLVSEAKSWQWSSARRRGVYGELLV